MHVQYALDLAPSFVFDFSQYRIAMPLNMDSFNCFMAVLRIKEAPVTVTGMLLS